MACVTCGGPVPVRVPPPAGVARCATCGAELLHQPRLGPDALRRLMDRGRLTWATHNFAGWCVTAADRQLLRALRIAPD